MKQLLGLLNSSRESGSDGLFFTLARLIRSRPRSKSLNVHAILNRVPPIDVDRIEEFEEENQERKQYEV